MNTAKSRSAAAALLGLKVAHGEFVLLTCRVGFLVLKQKGGRP